MDEKISLPDVPVDPEQAALQKMNPFETLAVGATTGILEVSLMQPTLYLKNATQQGLPLSFDPRKLYRGLAVSVGNMGVLTGLQFPLTGMVQKIITGGTVRKLSSGEQIGAGAIGGSISGLVCAPMELVMINQQRFGTSLAGTASKVVSEMGVFTLFRGLLMSSGREGIFTAGYLGIGPVLSYQLQQREWSAFPSKIAGSIAAGLLSATLSHPLDTIKTCMQGDVKQETYKGVMHTYRKLVADHGYLGFFKGWEWRALRTTCALYLIIECQSRLPRLFFPYHFQEERKSTERERKPAPNG